MEISLQQTVAKGQPYYYESVSIVKRSIRTRNFFTVAYGFFFLLFLFFSIRPWPSNQKKNGSYEVALLACQCAFAAAAFHKAFFFSECISFSIWGVLMAFLNSVFYIIHSNSVFLLLTDPFFLLPDLFFVAHMLLIEGFDTRCINGVSITVGQT